MRDVPDEEEEGLSDINPDDPEQQESYIRKLRGRYPKETAGMARDQLMELVREALARCPPLKIREPRDVLLFVALCILITPQQRKSKLLESVLRRVLEAIEDWSATKRLDFIYKHVVGRPAPDPEPDFGPWFVGATPPTS
jgi:hypothetical protein